MCEFFINVHNKCRIISQAGYNVVQTAITFSKLMKRLGYSKYIAQGGDWGSLIASSLPLVDPTHVHGMIPILLVRISSKLFT